MKIIYNIPANQVYVNCHKAALTSGFKIVKEDIEKYLIEFKVDMSFWSFGETFKIEINILGSNKTEVVLNSKSAMDIQIVDWGKNKENIDSFCNTLNELLRK